MNSLKYLVISLFIGLISFSCQRDLKLDTDKAQELLATMKDGETKVMIQFDHQLFYPENSSFKGNIILSNNRFNTNLFDQLDNNCAYGFSINKWSKPSIAIIKAEDPVMSKSSIMIGRMLDKSKNIGEGYVMIEGEIELQQLNEKACVVLLRGKVARFSSALADPKLWKPFTGILVWKKPTYQLDDEKLRKQFF